jgi:hypothetical protein
VLRAIDSAFIEHSTNLYIDFYYSGYCCCNLEASSAEVRPSTELLLELAAMLIGVPLK